MPSLIPIRHERLLVIILVLARVLLAVGFSAVGTLEGPDEPGHFAHVRVIATTGGLANPYLQTVPPGQYHQAPLYYLLAAPLGALVGVGTDDEFRAFLRFNEMGDTRLDISGKDNQNYWLHSRSDEFPYTGTPIARAVHLVRLLSVLLGGLTVLAAYAAFLQIWPTEAVQDARSSQAMRLMATGLIAFWPELIFLSSVINNDNLLLLLATLSIYLVLRQLRTGWTRRNAIALGIVLGLALLTKVNALLFLFPLGTAILVMLYQRRQSWRRLIRYPAVTLIAVVAVAGWWYARNAVLYGDPFNFRALYETWGGRTIQGSETNVALGYAVRGLPYVYQAWWARFGYTGMLTVSDGMYAFFAALSLLSVGGWFVWLLRSRVQRTPLLGTRLARAQALILGVWLVALFVGLLYYSGREFQGNQPRYMFPGLVPIGVLVVVGLRAYLPRAWLFTAAVLLTVTMAGLSTACLFGYYWPAFRPGGVPAAIAQPVQYRFGNPPVAELIGMAPVAPHGRPGDAVRITLYWRALRTPDRDLLVYLHSVGSKAVVRNSYPGAGTLLATDWSPGETWSETYTVTIPADTPPQMVYPLIAGLYERDTNETLSVYSADGALATPIIARFAVNGLAEALSPPDYRLGSAIGIAAPTVTVEGNGVRICLTWLALDSPARDYQVFVHLFDPDMKLLAQLDVEPRAGKYPTGAWARGERIEDCMQLRAAQIPPGSRISLGMLEPDTHNRLNVNDSSGHALENDELWLDVFPIPPRHPQTLSIKNACLIAPM